MKKPNKTKQELGELGDQYLITKLQKSIELLQKESISSDEMDLLATTAYEFFLVAHWSILDYVKEEERQTVIYDLTNTVYHNLLVPPD